MVVEPGESDSWVWCVALQCDAPFLVGSNPSQCRKLAHMWKKQSRIHCFDGEVNGVNPFGQYWADLCELAGNLWVVVWDRCEGTAASAQGSVVVLDDSSTNFL